MVIADRDLESQLRTIRQQCIDFLFQLLFRGKGRRFAEFRERQANVANMTTELRPLPAFSIFKVEGVQTSYQYSESESTSFSTAGIVRTADGREIEFSLNLLMTREFQAVYEESYMEVSQIFCDTLVINLDGNIAELEDQTFVFDIDSDGTLDRIARLAPRSGYLAWDRNEDGTINDGNELFGTASGNGFADLARHDSDGNGWIDEADEIWAKLLIWIMENDGSSRLYTLAEKEVGAIYLGNVATEFMLTELVNDHDDDAHPGNKALGAIRNSGIFLYESGAVGSMQQIDVAKQ
jgi:hypothetical protein